MPVARIAEDIAGPPPRPERKAAFALNRWHGLLLAIVAVGAAGCGQEDAPQDYPAKPIKLVVPFGAGGGSDTFAWVFKQAIEENQLLPQPLVVVNVGGAGATIGSRRVLTAPPDGYTVLLLHDAIVMAKHSGKVSFGPEAFEAVAGTSESGTVMAVRSDSPYQDLSAVVTAAADRPHTVTFGCNLGTPTHFVGLLLERARPAAHFRFVQTGDGAQRFAALQGGHIELTVFSSEEYLRYRSEGIRALAFFGAQRHPAMPDTRTAIEQGFEIQAGIMQYWWMPKQTPPARVAAFAEALEAAMQTDAVQEFLGRTHAQPTFVKGAELARRIDSLDQKVSAVDLRQRVRMPNLPLLVSLGIVGLAAVVLVQWLRRSTPPVGLPKPVPRYRLAAVCSAVLVTYVLALGIQVGPFAIDFRIATLLFVVGSSWCIGQRRRQSIRWAIALALLLALGLHFLFTQVFVIDLP